MASRTRKASTKSSVDSVLASIDKPQEYLIFQMGEAYQYYGVPPNIKFSVDYPGLGKKMWRALQYELHQVLCNRKKLKEELDEFLSGNNLRELSTAMLTIFVAQLSVPLSIAVPATAMVIKLGLNKFCAKNPPKKQICAKELLSQNNKKRLPKKQ